MTIISSLRLSAVALFLVAGPAAAQTEHSSPELDATIASLLNAFGVPSVSVAIVKDGKPFYAKAFGERNLAQHQPAETGTRYAVGSISKQFAAAGLLLEQEQGKVSLDDKVAKYLPDLTRANEVSIRQLLSHTSGYEDYAPQDYLIQAWTSATTPDAILDNWAKKPLNFDPGTQWQYSNTNYVIAGKILEKVSGQPLVPFLTEHIFKPLAMESAGDCDAKSPADASSYTRYALGPPRPVGREGPGWYFAAGELCMTASDLAKWDASFLAKGILMPKSYGEFTGTIKLKNGKDTGYALGLQVAEVDGIRRISHTGEVSGFLAANTLYPAKQLAIVVLTNEDGVNFIGPMTQTLSQQMMSDGKSSAFKRDEKIKEILDGLQGGHIDRRLFTENANAYFSEVALSDYRNSLEPLGKLMVLRKEAEEPRGGMTHLRYQAHYEKNTVAVSIYVMPDGKFEQFLVEEQF